jgi:hypothetical protein
VMNNPDAASGLRSARLRATGAQLVLISLALGACPGIQPALARLGFGGGVGYHPVYGADVRPAVGVGAVDRGFYNRPYAGFHPAWVNCGYGGGTALERRWYRVNPVGWNWWGANAAAWGLTGQ